MGYSFVNRFFWATAIFRRVSLDAVLPLRAWLIRSLVSWLTILPKLDFCIAAMADEASLDRLKLSNFSACSLENILPYLHPFGRAVGTFFTNLFSIPFVIHLYDPFVFRKVAA